MNGGHRISDVLNAPATGFVGMCKVCGGYEHFDMPRTCPNRLMTPLESAMVYAGKLECINHAWAWNATIDWQIHGEPSVGTH